MDEYETMSKTIDRTFGVIAVVAVLSSIASISFIGALIYLLLKNFG